MRYPVGRGLGRGGRSGLGLRCLEEEEGVQAGSGAGEGGIGVGGDAKDVEVAVGDGLCGVGLMQA